MHVKNKQMGRGFQCVGGQCGKTKITLKRVSVHKIEIRKMSREFCLLFFVFCLFFCQEIITRRM